MSKIVLYIDSMHRGGAERVMSILANHFSETGHTVVLITDIPIEYNKNDYNISKKIECIAISSNNQNYLLKNLYRIFLLRKIVKKKKTDIALSFLGRQNYRMLIATFGLRCKKCVSVRNNPEMEYGKSWIRKCITNIIFSCADLCIFQTKSAQKYFNKKIQEKSKIIPNPIDEKFFNVSKSKNPKNIITVGRLEPQKNQKLLIDAFNLINKRISNEKLLIYGNGSLKQTLQKYINEIGLANRIILKNEVEDIEKELARARLFVLSSDYEGMPNALMEAMAANVPCIATDCPCYGPRELFKNNKQNLLVRCNDPSALSEALIKALNNTKLHKKNINDMSEYRPENILAKWDKTFDKLLHEGRHK